MNELYIAWVLGRWVGYIIIYGLVLVLFILLLLVVFMW